MLSSNELKQLELSSAEIVRKIGKFVRESWGRSSDISSKDAKDITTNIDVEAENMFREKLHLLLLYKSTWTISKGRNSKNCPKMLPSFMKFREILLRR